MVRMMVVAYQCVDRFIAVEHGYFFENEPFRSVVNLNGPSAPSQNQPETHIPDDLTKAD